MSKSQLLKEAFNKVANTFVKSEFEYYSEYGWGLATCLIHINDSAEGSSDKKTLLNLHRIFVEAGRTVEFSNEEYEKVQYTGSNKNQIHPLIDGKRWVCKYTDHDFEKLYS